MKNWSQNDSSLNLKKAANLIRVNQNQNPVIQQTQMSSLVEVTLTTLQLKQMISETLAATSSKPQILAASQLFKQNSKLAQTLMKIQNPNQVPTMAEEQNVIKTQGKSKYSKPMIIESEQSYIRKIIMI